MNRARAFWPRLGRWHDRLTRLGLVLATAALACLWVAYCIEVLKRYALSAPTLWASDLVSYLLCAMLFLALPAVTAARRHIVIRLIVDRVGARRARTWLRWVSALGFAACLVICGYALLQAFDQVARTAYTVATLQIYKSWLSVLMAYGFGSSAIYFLRTALYPGTAPLSFASGRALG